MQKNVTKKLSDLCKNSPNSGSPKSDRFVVFQGSIPAWSLGRPWGGCRAQKHMKMEVQMWIFCHLRTLFSLSLETFGNIFVCSMNDNLIVLDVNLLFSLLRLGWKTYGRLLLNDSSKIHSPRFHLNASFSIIHSHWLLVNDFFSMVPPR